MITVMSHWASTVLEPTEKCWHHRYIFSWLPVAGYEQNKLLGSRERTTDSRRLLILVQDRCISFAEKSKQLHLGYLGQVEQHADGVLYYLGVRHTAVAPYITV